MKFQVKRFRNEANNNGSNEGIHRDTVSTLSKTRFPRLIASDKAELFHILFHFASFSPFLNSTFPPPSQTLLYKLSLFLFVAFLPSLLFFSFFIVGNAESIASGKKKICFELQYEQLLLKRTSGILFSLRECEISCVSR